MNTTTSHPFRGIGYPRFEKQRPNIMTRWYIISHGQNYYLDFYLIPKSPYFPGWSVEIEAALNWIRPFKH
jgi:hypothetical protein